MLNFDAIESYALFQPLGLVVHVIVVAFSAWLCAIARGWLGWTMYGALTILLTTPAVIALHACYTALCDLGVGLMMLVTVPLAVAWVLGWLLGLLFRFLHKRQPQSA